MCQRGSWGRTGLWATACEGESGHRHTGAPRAHQGRHRQCFCRHQRSPANPRSRRGAGQTLLTAPAGPACQNPASDLCAPEQEGVSGTSDLPGLQLLSMKGTGRPGTRLLCRRWEGPRCAAQGEGHLVTSDAVFAGLCSLEAQAPCSQEFSALPPHGSSPGCTGCPGPWLPTPLDPHCPVGSCSSSPCGPRAQELGLG